MKRRKHQKFRSRGGIRLPAAITLCLALSLLIFSRAGGEPIAQKALTGLAHNSGFVTRAMALEFGVSPDDTAEVYTPSTAAAARDEQAENPLAESTYVPSSDTENDNPVLSAADKAATVSINNETWMRQTVLPQTSIFPQTVTDRRCLSITHMAAKATRRMPLFRIHRPRPSARPIPIIM